jgi:hypothetical protein
MAWKNREAMREAGLGRATRRDGGGRATTLSKGMRRGRSAYQPTEGRPVSAQLRSTTAIRHHITGLSSRQALAAHEYAVQ